MMKMTNPPLIALAGVARCGKDDFAKPLIERGFKRLAFGDVIKEFYQDFVAGDIGIYEATQRIVDANPLVSHEQLEEFQRDVLTPFWVKADGVYDVFSENDAEKNLFRPILEKGGDLIYWHVHAEYFRRVDAAWSAGTGVVNPRLVRPAEAHTWVKRGGHLILIDCLHRDAISQWEKDAMTELKRSGTIGKVIGNWGTAEEWQARAERFADGLVGPKQVAS